MRAGILDVGIWNPAEHFTTLCQHFFRAGVEICENLDRHTGSSDEGRDSLDNFPVFSFLFLCIEFSARGDALLYLGILGDKTGICCLSIDEAKYGFDLCRFLGIATIDKDPDLARFYSIDWQIVPNLMMDLVVPRLTAFMTVYHAGQIQLIKKLIRTQKTG